MATNQRLGTQGLDRRTWLGLGGAGLAVAITVNLLNGLLSPPRQVLAQAQPMVLESTPLASGSESYLVQGDRLYSLRQISHKGRKTKQDELWVKDGLSEKRIHSWPDRTDGLALQFLGNDDQTLLIGGPPGTIWSYDGKAMESIVSTDRAILAPFSVVSFKGQGPTQFIWPQNSDQGSDRGSELWRLGGKDKVVRSIYKFASPNNGETRNVYPHSFTPLQDRLLFTTGLSGGLWQTDGQKTRRIADINPASQPFTPWGQRVFMEAESKAQGWELWTSDGKTAQSLGDFYPGPESSAPQILGGKKDLLFLARTPKGHELFATQGTIATTRSVKVLNPRTTNLLNPGIASLGDRLFFAVDVAQGTELWVSDGTTARTIRLAQVPVKSGITNLTAIGNRVVFSASDRSGIELWSSDGTVKGTGLVRDLAPGGIPSTRISCDSFNNPRNPSALPVVSPGAGVPDVVPPGPPQGGPPPPPPCLKPKRQSISTTIIPNSSAPQQLTVFKGQVYFLAYGKNGQDLWVTDGTDRGTRLLQSIVTQGTIIPLTNWLEIRSAGPTGQRTWVLR